MIGIVDYGCGNIKSLYNSLSSINMPFEIISSGNIPEKYDKLILPGVGAFGLAMEKLTESGFQYGLSKFIENGGRLIGICVGMQILFETSDEFGVHNGLGFLRGSVTKINEFTFEDGSRLKLPHIGWRSLTKNKDSDLKIGIDSEFYFVHSFKVQCDNKMNLYYVEYGKDQIPAIINYENIYGLQFHPEKSRGHGLELLRNLLS